MRGSFAWGGRVGCLMSCVLRNTAANWRVPGDLGHQSPQATKGDVSLTPEILQVVLLSPPMSWILLHKLALVWIKTFSNGTRKSLHPAGISPVVGYFNVFGFFSYYLSFFFHYKCWIIESYFKSNNCDWIGALLLNASFSAPGNFVFYDRITNFYLWSLAQQKIAGCCYKFDQESLGLHQKWIMMFYETCLYSL